VGIFRIDQWPVSHEEKERATTEMLWDEVHRLLEERDAAKEKAALCDDLAEELRKTTNHAAGLKAVLEEAAEQNVIYREALDTIKTLADPEHEVGDRQTLTSCFEVARDAIRAALKIPEDS
jgi:hypothetical protein